MRCVFGSLCVGLLLIGLVGCGGDKETSTADSSTSGSPSSTPTTPKPSPPSPTDNKPKDAMGGDSLVTTDPSAGGGDDGGYGAGGAPGAGDGGGSLDPEGVGGDVYGEGYGGGADGAGDGAGSLDPEGVGGGVYGEGYGGGADGGGSLDPDGVGGGVYGGGADGAGGGGSLDPDGVGGGVYGGGPNGGGDPSLGDPYGGGRQTPKKPATFTELANQAFGQGREDDAFQYSYANILTDEAAAKAAKLHMVAGLKEPKLAVRWGVGVQYTAPKDFKSKPPALSDYKPPKKDSRGGGPGNLGGGDLAGGDPSLGGYGGGRASGSKAKQQLAYYASEVGEELISRLEMRREREYFGALLKNVSTATGGQNDGFGGLGGDPYGAGAGGGGSLDPSGVGGGVYGDGGRGAGEVSSDQNGINPGVSMLGVGTSKELVEKGKEFGLDVVAVCLVTVVKSRRTNVVSKSVQVKLYTTKDGKEVAKTASLNSAKVYFDKEKSAASTPVEDNIDPLFNSYVDENLKVSELPDLKPEQVKFRVESLVASQHENPLPALAEIKYFHVRGLMTDEEFSSACQQLVGEEKGVKLATGTVDEKKEALADWMPGNRKVEADEEFR